MGAAVKLIAEAQEDEMLVRIRTYEVHEDGTETLLRDGTLVDEEALAGILSLCVLKRLLPEDSVVY
jgi:hypothetical protein